MASVLSTKRVILALAASVVMAAGLFFAARAVAEPIFRVVTIEKKAEDHRPDPSLSVGEQRDMLQQLNDEYYTPDQGYVLLNPQSGGRPHGPGSINDPHVTTVITGEPVILPPSDPPDYLPQGPPPWPAQGNP